MGQIRYLETPAILVMDLIISFLDNVQYGYLSLTIQDGVVVSVESVEKFVISVKNRNARYVKVEKSARKHPLQDVLLSELKGIRYGQFVIRVEKGQVEKLEKAEKWRMDELGWINGDGI